MTPVQTDDLLGRVLGGSLEAATFRLVGGALAAAAVAALMIWLI